MSEELAFNINKATAEFLNQNISKITDIAKTSYRNLTDQLKLRLKITYRNYLQCVFDRQSKAKSFLIRNEPSFLYDFYAPLGVTCEKRNRPNAAIDNIISKSNFAVITGSAGSGKSMMMRHLFLDTIVQAEKIPVFVDLRDLNDGTISLLDLIKYKLKKNKFNLDDDYIDKALDTGHFAFFLDGFDEVTYSERQSVTKSIQELTQDFDENYIIVSSRPDQEFGGWHLFDIWQINPLTLDLACELVFKTHFENDFKSKFIKDLKDKLFEEHKSFLSNPLLLSIMLLTYQENAKIPTKLSIFYDQAYQVLFQRHDALKSTFTRKRHCNLDIKDFEKVFSAFSILTYEKRALRFSRMRILDYLETTKKLINISFDAEEYLIDATQAVCLLVEDGNEITFAHSSLQEYFTALYISQLNSIEKQRNLLIHFLRPNQNNVLRLLDEISPDLLEKAFIIPCIQKIEEAINLNDELEITHYKNFIEIVLGKYISLNENQIIFNVELDIFTDNISQNNLSSDIFFNQVYGFVMLRYRNVMNIYWNNFFNENHELISKLRRMFIQPNDELSNELDKVSEIEIDKIINNPDLLQLFSNGNHFYSLKNLKDFISIKNLLIKKHRLKEISIEEELLKGNSFI
jgi:hypothetical protein